MFIAFSTDMFKYNYITKVEAIETTTTTKHRNNTKYLREIIETSIDSDIKGGYIQLKIMHLIKMVMLNFIFNERLVLQLLIQRILTSY